jgi:fatty-acyl-CoA synthase
LIIRGGHNIDPAAIELPLYAHPAVQLAAAVGRPDSYAGEVPVAYVQLKPGHQAAEEELLAHLDQHIGERAAMPKAIIVIDQMPMTAVGKIYKPELKRQQTEYALQQALIAEGVQIKSVLVVADDGKRGTSVLVDLVVAEDESAAAAVLGRFPFTYRLTWSDGLVEKDGHTRRPV